MKASYLCVIHYCDGSRVSYGPFDDISSASAYLSKLESAFERINRKNILWSCSVMTMREPIDPDRIV